MDAPATAPTSSAALAPAVTTAGPPAVPAPRTAAGAGHPGDDRLSAEVRESLLLLVLSLAVTVGLAGAVSAALSLLA
ncbi:MAG TPA: hypothetical protein VNU26_09330 [Mycobacteriales bacterium]|nr:hypothetical protein [Mycobacteriales bacterium]